MKKSLTSKLNQLVKNWDKIPDDFKVMLAPENYNGNVLIPGVSIDEHIVVLLLDRQKPSIRADYSFDEERIAINRNGKILWGFDSGCSCPSPWKDNYPDCYKVSKTWKQFSVNLEDFDDGVLDEVEKRVDEILKK